MITQKLKRYSFDSLNFVPAAEGRGLKKGFALRLRLKKLPAGNGDVLFEIPGGLNIRTRIVTREDLTWYEQTEHYLCHADENGKVAVLEARFCFIYPMRPDWKEMRVGIPLSLFDISKNDIYLVYDGLRICWYWNGDPVNRNYPMGILAVPDDAQPYVGEDLLECADISGDVRFLRCEPFERTIGKSFAFYSPHGYNSWAGDVVNFYRDGIYHVLYLIDSHHHGNRWGSGVHHFEHVTTADFINWTDWGPVFEISKPWQSVGTGVMFFYGGKYYVSYGYHTGRVIDEDLLASPDLLGQYKKSGEIRSVSYSDIFAEGKFPNGANYAVSDDGIHFTEAGKQFHWAENPSIYDRGGKLEMYTGGSVWQSPDIDGPWKRVREGFPPCGAPPMFGNGDCPSFFELNGYKYIIIGFTDYWRTEKDSDEYINSAAMGYDIYEGLNVPMAVNMNGRLIYAGWLGGIGWGSVIVHRELIQDPDGRLGIKWLPELAPEAGAPVPAEDGLDPDLAYYIEADIDPGDGTGRAALRFSGENGGCELQLDFAAERAQFAGLEIGFSSPIKPAHEKLPHGDRTDIHNGSRNFSIAHVDVMKVPFMLRGLLRPSRKMGTVIIDAEIAGQRTLICNRPGLKVNRLETAAEGGAHITGLRLFRTEDEIIF